VQRHSTCREEVAETTYRPLACRNDYRPVIARKRLVVRDRNQLEFFPDYRYFLHLTNDCESTPEEIVFSANDRCQQEHVLAQLHGLRELLAPVDNLQSNWAFDEAEERALPAIPGQQPIDELEAGAHDLARQPDHAGHERAELYLEELLVLNNVAAHGGGRAAAWSTATARPSKSKPTRSSACNSSAGRCAVEGDDAEAGI
jgi:hypothetical protein